MKILLSWCSALVLIFILHVSVLPPIPAPIPVVVRDSVSMVYAERFDIPYELSEVIVRKANKYRIPHRLAFRIAWVESRYNPEAVSSSDAIGLVQVLPSTALMLDSSITRDSLFVPENNVEMGFRFLSQMRHRYGGDWWKALVAYNQGPRYADTMTVTVHPYADLVLRRTK